MIYNEIDPSTLNRETEQQRLEIFRDFLQSKKVKISPSVELTTTSRGLDVHTAAMQRVISKHERKLYPVIEKAFRKYEAHAKEWSKKAPGARPEKIKMERSKAAKIIQIEGISKASLALKNVDVINHDGVVGAFTFLSINIENSLRGRNNDYLEGLKEMLGDKHVDSAVRAFQGTNNLEEQAEIRTRIFYELLDETEKIMKPVFED